MYMYCQYKRGHVGFHTVSLLNGHVTTMATDIVNIMLLCETGPRML